MSLKLVSENRDSYVLTATDTKGHSERFYFRAIPAMASEVQSIIQSKVFPFRTRGDVLRWCFHYGMRYLMDIAQEASPLVKSVRGQVNAVLEIMRDEEFNSDFTLVFDKLRERIDHHRRDREDEEAVRLLLVVKNMISDMPEGFWRKKYMDELEKSYGKFIKDARKCKISDLE